jgi:hypothetical protein
MLIVTEPGGNVDLNTRGYRKTQARTHYIITIKKLRKIIYKSKPQKVCIKYYIF